MIAGLPLSRSTLFVACLTSQQHASVSQGWICEDNFTCFHTQTEVADQTVHLTQSQYTYTGPTSPSTDPITPGAWQGSHWSAKFEVTGMTRPRNNPGASGIRTRDLPLWRRTPQPLAQRGGRGLHLSTWPPRRSKKRNPATKPKPVFGSCSFSSTCAPRSTVPCVPDAER